MSKRVRERETCFGLVTGTRGHGGREGVGREDTIERFA